MICHEKKEQLLKEIKFLWDDMFYKAFPVCPECLKTCPEEHLHKRLNTWAREVNMPKPKKINGGLDKWLQK